MSTAPRKVRDKLADIERILDVDHPEHRSSDEVREALNNPSVRSYIATWAVTPLKQIEEWARGEISTRDFYW